MFKPSHNVRRRRVALAVLAFLSFACGAPALAEPAAQSQQTENSIGMQLRHVPAGEFQMGNAEAVADLLRDFPTYKVESKTEYLFEDEAPRHRVRITKSFYFGRTEVTVGQFRRFVDESGYKTEPERDGKGGWGYNPDTGKCEGRDVRYSWRNPGFAQTDAHPVVNVTWNDCNAFCEWLGRKENRTYRLPTEAEWEYACRAGTTSRYATGQDPAELIRQANVIDPKTQGEFGHVQEISMRPDDKFTLPVAGFAPNAWGLCDMHGNVWEWCSDWYGRDYYAKSPTDDPPGADSGIRRVRRGGAWNSFPLYARASFRNWNKPDTRCVNLGFRVVLMP